MEHYPGLAITPFTVCESHTTIEGNTQTSAIGREAMSSDVPCFHGAPAVAVR